MIFFQKIKLFSLLMSFALLCACKESLLLEDVTSDVSKLLRGDSNEYIDTETPRLIKQLEIRRGVADLCELITFLGDIESPYGDGSADYNSQIQCPNFEKLTLRLKQTKKRKLIILGYKTENSLIEK